MKKRRKRRITFWIDAELDGRMKQLAERSDFPYSHVVRVACDIGAAEMERMDRQLAKQRRRKP